MNPHTRKMSAEDLGERLLGEVEPETLDKVGDDDLNSVSETAVLTPHHSSYKPCAIEKTHNHCHKLVARPSTSY